MLQRFFALSDAGTRNLRSAITFGTIINLFLIMAYYIARVRQLDLQDENI